MQLAPLLFFLVIPFTFFASKCSTWIFLVASTLGAINNKEEYKQYIKLPLMITSLLLCILFIISTLWSVTPKITFLTSLEVTLTTLLTPGFLSTTSEIYNHPKFKIIFITVCIITCFLILGETFLNHPFLIWKQSTSGRSFTPVSLLLSLTPALIFLLIPIKKIQFSLSSLIFLTLYQIDNDTALITFIISTILLRIPKFLFNKLKNITLICVIFVSLFFPLTVSLYLTPQTITNLNQKFLHQFSYTHRLHIWHNVSKKIVQKPWIGYGFNTSRSEALSGNNESMFIKHFNKDGTVIERQSPFIPTHPHNVFLQIWLEGGAIAITLFIAIFYTLLRYTNHIAPLVFIGSVIFIMSVNVGAWQTWWLTSIIMLGGVIYQINTNKIKNFNSV